MDMKQRREELFRPIDKQIMLTNDLDDVLLLSSLMLETAIKIFVTQYGVATAENLIATVFDNIVRNKGSNIYE